MSRFCCLHFRLARLPSQSLSFSTHGRLTTHRAVLLSKFAPSLARCCGNVANEPSFLEKLKSQFQGSAPPLPHVARLVKPAKLYSDADVQSEAATELPEGELVETFADLEQSTEWVLVRAPLEDMVDVMSDKPLQYEDGWLHNPSLELAEHQVGAKVCAIVDVHTHPVLQTLKYFPKWQKAPLPQPLQDAVCEFHVGKIGGVAKRGRFIVQRPSGAIPERIATGEEKLIVPRQRWRRTALASLVGMIAASCLGCALSGGSWLYGSPMYSGRSAWPNVVGWLTIVVVFVTPLTTYPCYLFQISQLSTASAILWLNMLFYNDIFSE